MTENAPTFNKVRKEMQRFIPNQNVVALNGFAFDFHCLNQTMEYFAMKTPKYAGHCTYKIYGDNLASICERFNITLRHRDALSDAGAFAELIKMHLVTIKNTDAEN